LPIGSDSGVRALFVWEETRVPGEYPHDRAGLPTYDTRGRTQIILVRSEYTARPHTLVYLHVLVLKNHC